VDTMLITMQTITPDNIRIEDYDYPLPADRIAEKPLEERDSSKLLISKGGEIRHSLYSNLADALPFKTALFFNNTRVIPARLHFIKSSGSVIEVFLLEPETGNYETLYAKTAVFWKCMVGGVKKWKNQETLTSMLHVNNKDVVLEADLVSKSPQYCTIKFVWHTDNTFLEIINAAGQIPLPPYIKREVTENDKLRYQTVYAHHNGSVAAPTAGLHFNEQLMKKLHATGINSSFLTLHVGAGTFRPVSADTIAGHEMHEEHFEVDIDALQVLTDETNKIIPVGTTSMRTLESLYWIGVKLLNEGKITEQQLLTLSQWEDRELSSQSPPPRSAVFKWLKAQLLAKGITKLRGKTGICIVPGYQFRVCDGLITNFHQPRSTLLLLIAAMVGDKWKHIYETALASDYRFLSYGDGCLIMLPD
jgi:S-adenosylmethionine:tRNA ribosyltransferase-isomerase